MITNEFVREIHEKINVKKYILEIVKLVVKNEKNDAINLEVEGLILENLNPGNIIDFYEILIYAGDLGEFYTPKCIADLIFQIVGNVENLEIYEPTIGSGNLINKFYAKNEIYGQEFNAESAEITKLILPNAKIETGDTLSNDKFEEKKFDLIISNPPYGGSGWIPFEHEKFKPEPMNKKEIESAFIQHNAWKLSNVGKCLMVLPLGVLFRSGKEKKMREYLVNENLIDGVIVLPPNLFSNTGIPVILLILNKNKKDDNILFVNAEKEFLKNKKINLMEEKNINKIVDIFKNRKEIEKFSKLVDKNEIIDNDYNLNINRYVDTFEEEEPIDIDAIFEEVKKNRIKQKELIKNLIEQHNELFGKEEFNHFLKLDKLDKEYDQLSNLLEDLE